MDRDTQFYRSASARLDNTPEGLTPSQAASVTNMAIADAVAAGRRPLMIEVCIHVALEA